MANTSDRMTVNGTLYYLMDAEARKSVNAISETTANLIVLNKTEFETRNVSGTATDHGTFVLSGTADADNAAVFVNVYFISEIITVYAITIVFCIPAEIADKIEVLRITSLINGRGVVDVKIQSNIKPWQLRPL